MTALRYAAWVGVVAGLVLAGCGGGDTPSASGPRPIFGDGKLDNTRVVATVNGENITERMLDLRQEELTGSDKARFGGPEGRRLLVRKMVDELLRVRAAEAERLDLDPTVSRVLIVQYRNAMDLAKNGTIVKGVEPTVDQVREYFERNQDRYTKLGTMHASHIACPTREQAEAAYEAVRSNKMSFSTAARKLSKNPETAARGGDLGWFNKGGFVPGIKDSDTFTEAVWGLQHGINPPLQVGDTWHVVMVHDIQYERPQTLDEAYQRVVSDLTPELQAQAVRDWSDQAQQAAKIEYFGEFRPGNGKTAKELLERAFYAKDPQQKADLLTLLIEDYPDDEYTDDAMFMAANVYLDTWGDRRKASFFLLALLRKFPDSDYAADAQYLLDNLDHPERIQPRSIEDLRK
ncbi:MAG: peptidylprolyl isomerase [Candidatus Krumholzibacteriia bacterium]